MQGFTKKSNEVKTDWYESTARDVSLLALRNKELARPDAIASPRSRAKVMSEWTEATCARQYLK